MAGKLKWSKNHYLDLVKITWIPKAKCWRITLEKNRGIYGYLKIHPGTVELNPNKYFNAESRIRLKYKSGPKLPTLAFGGGNSKPFWAQ